MPEQSHLYLLAALGQTDPAVIDKFTYGVLSAYLPQLQKAQSSLQDLT